MGGSKLVEETLDKDLGVWILADMKCSQQCRYAVNKANKVLDMITRRPASADRTARAANFRRDL